MTGPFILNICDINNKSYSVHCMGNGHTIGYIKYILMDKYDLSSEYFGLYLGEIQLNEYKTFEHYKIDKNSKIKILINMKSGF
jgi:hypothetical protein